MHLTRSLAAGRLLTLVCLLLSLHLSHASATAAGRSHPKGREARAATSRARIAQDLQDLETKTFDLTHGDHERVEKFKLMFLMRAYGIIARSYFELAASAADWGTAVDIFEELAAISNEFKEYSEPPEDPQLPEFFSTYADFLKRHAELCAYIKGRLAEKSLTPDQGAVLFGRFVTRRPAQGSQQFKMIDVIALNYILDLGALNEKRRMERLGPVIAGFRQRYGFDVPKISDAGFKLPFKLPFEEFDGAPGYLYETYVRGTDVSDFLKLHYQDDLVRIAGKVGIETAFNTLEIGTFYLELAKAGRKMGAFADIVMGTALDCVNYNRRVAKRAYYSDAYDLHAQIYKAVAGNTEDVKQSVEFARKKLAGSVGEGQLRAGDAGALFAFAEEYLKQRGELRDYVKKQANLASASLTRFDKDGGDLLMEELTKPVLAAISGRMRELLPGPCRAYEIIKKKR